MGYESLCIEPIQTVVLAAQLLNQQLCICAEASLSAPLRSQPATALPSERAVVHHSF